MTKCEKNYHINKIDNPIPVGLLARKVIPNQSNVISTPTEASIEIPRLLFQ
jgi:hypothetical protein